MNTSHASVAVSAFHDNGATAACCCTISFSDTLPASSNTGIVAMPMEISYDTICALDRSPPRSEYLLFDDQPARTIPYTPIDVIARMYRNPIGSDASARSMRPQGDSHGAPNGITAHAI